jgi:hypothetical protein
VASTTNRAVLHLRSWLFSEGGAALACLALLVSAALSWLLLARPQNEVTRGAMFLLGIWWLACIVVVQLLIPAGTDEDGLAEGLAAAGWQATAAILCTGAWTWISLFEGGVYRNQGIGAAAPVLLVWFAASVLAGVVVIWLRGHSLGDVVRYSAMGTAAGTVWMALGLVLSLPH